MGIFGQSKKEKDLQSEIESLKRQLLPEQQQIENLKLKISELEKERSIINEKVKSDRLTLNKQVEQINNLNNEIQRRKSQIFSLDFDISMQEYGLYKPTYVFANSDLYKENLAEIREKQKQAIKDNTACTANNNWTINNSVAKGNQMVKDMQKLLLRAFNIECDDIIANVKISNIEKSKDRIYKIREQISRLGNMMSISITDYYTHLKIRELYLALDFQQKKQEEKEHIKALKEQQREEARVQKEIEEARKKLKKEHSHYTNALESIMSQINKYGETAELINKKLEIESQLVDIEKAIDDVDYREANKRAGYVYIISNIGAFGKDVYKIGMTRRLDPMERVEELGDASVPFKFDVHALIFTDDAPKLENALHVAFESKKINKVNHKREFFKVTLEEIKTEVRRNYDKTVEWIDYPEAEQYRQSLIMV